MRTRMTIGAAAVAWAGMAGQANAQYCETVDLNGCGCLNIFQVVVLFQMWGEAGGNGIADFDASGKVDGLDLGYLLAHADLWGDLDEGCMALPQPADVEIVVVDATTEDDVGAGQKRYDLFVPFANADDTVINVFDGNVGCSVGQCFFGGFFDESFVSIGSEEADGDANFNTNDFGAGTGIGMNGGWWIFPPDGEHPGRAGQYEDNMVRIAEFLTPEESDLSGTLSVLWRTVDQELFTGTAEFAVQGGKTCYADINGDGSLDILDFIAFQNAFQAQDPAADCNGCGCYDILQFICFQQKFVDGCP